MKSATSFSPLTGMACDSELHTSPIDYVLFDEPLLDGQWGVTAHLMDHGFGFTQELEDGSCSLNMNQTESLVALARSKVWLSHRLPERNILFIGEEELQSVSKRAMKSAGWSNLQLITPLSLWNELQGLTLVDKAMMTLSNLAVEERLPGQGVKLPINREKYPGSFWAITKETQELTYPHGLLYACCWQEGLVVLNYLEEMNYIRWMRYKNYYSEVHLTMAGYDYVDRMRKGLAADAKVAFLVCRFNDTMDDVYDNVYQPAGSSQELSCPIHRVKDVDHVDRIDDRILNMIEGATIVIVDLTDAKRNFNVALEAGYAMALGKPIIWTMRKTKGKINLPFDIHTHNLMTWERGEDGTYGDFLNRLRARMIVAIEKAGN
jgi:hypothetical protein